MVYLTRRDDLIVTEEPGDFGIDLSVTLNAENKGWASQIRLSS